MGFDSVLVEGPDGAGKSTLLAYLKKDPMFSRLKLRDPWVPSTGPTSPDSLTAMVIDDAAHPAPLLYDRHPLTSQPIYGRVLQTQPRGWFNDDGTLTLWYAQSITALSNRAVLVLCLPPYPQMLKTLAEQKALSSQPQMPGVIEHAHELWSAYHDLPCLWPGVSIRYDYTQDSRAFKTLLLRRILNDR